MSNIIPRSYNTISSLAEQLNDLDISYEQMNLKTKLKINDTEAIINTTSLIDKYYDYILKTVYVKTLTDKEYITYRFRPKLFCYDFYGTVELWALLLKVNNWTSIAEFNATSFKVFDDSIFNILNEIFILESEKIKSNRDKIGY